MSRVHWDSKNYVASIEEKLDNGQTIELSMSEWDWNDDTVYFNTCLSLYSKRKQIKENESEVRTTGKDTFLTTWRWTEQAFFELEKWILERFGYVNIVIYVNWADNRRRDIYYHFLSRHGYQYGRDLDGHKVIYKKVKMNGEV